jgi:sortase A
MLVGVFIFFYPGLKSFYQDQQQESIIENWEQTVYSRTEETDILPELSLESIRELENTFANSNHIEETTTSPPIVVETIEEKKPVAPAGPEVLGIIEIAKIKARMPVIKGTSEKVLDMGAGYLEGTAYPGQVGNSAIAAHRSRTYGRMFNRLGEVEKGDKITIKTDKGTYQYEVFDTFLVKPNDLSVLQKQGDSKILTLITCHPTNNPTHRLIVQAILK